MRPEPLHDPALDAHLPELRAFNAKIPREDSRMRWTLAAIERARDLSQVMGGIFKPSTLPGFAERTIPGPRGPIRLRTFVPEVVRAVYYDVHGGGFSGRARDGRPRQRRDRAARELRGGKRRLPARSRAPLPRRP